MKIIQIIAVAAAAAFLALPSTAQNKALFPAKNKLQLENQQLRRELDSLKLELEKVCSELSYADSVNNSLLNPYAESEISNTNVIAPEEYTPAVSDSLLSIWYLHQ